ncbi:Vacuolar membrane protein, related [Eimeria brunetti]|uniref:Vacuolar membrane protein, related n=1 Tax=Eimeria brunetti TaxID=51314 RepID=U6LGS3_9EIME|nr:Vacuolar membrane protein, related [Eimeria brunetti]
MQQLRRLNFFDRSIVERTIRPPVISNGCFRGAGVSPDGDLSSGQAQQHAAATGPIRMSPLPSSVTVCTVGTDSALWLGDNAGFLHTLDHDLQLKSLKSFDICFVAMHAAASASCIVCIGRDAPTDKSGNARAAADGSGQSDDLRMRQGVLKYKCYSTTQVDANGNPVLLREAGLFSKIPEQVFVCSDINQNFTMLAVGTETAGICLFRGNLLKEKTCRLRLMRESDERIVSVRFLTSPSDPKIHYMLVCYASSITCYVVPLKGEPKVSHTDSVPAGSTLVVSSLPSLGTFVVHHDEGIFCVDPDQGNLWALPAEGHCHILTTHKSYIVSVTTEEASAENELTRADGAGSLLQASTSFPSKSAHQTLTIHLCYPDVRLIAYSSPMRGVLHVVSAMDTLFVIAQGGSTDSNVLFDVKEKSFNERLSILLRKRLFNWAAEVALQDNQPQQVLQEVYRLHGDWLYSKNMPDRAVEMYIKTIGFLEPSAVIQKFLDSQDLRHLALYLLHLHVAGCAMQQHTLLFFKCTARLKDDSLLASFLEDPRISKTCSLTVALNECRLNGDTELACTIASRHGYHDEHLSLLLETHVEIFIPLFVDDSDLLLLFLSLLVHGVPVARRLVPQYEGLCSDSKLQDAVEEARLAISANPSIFGCIPFSSLLELLLRKWHATHRPFVNNGGAYGGIPNDQGLQGLDTGGKAPELSSVYAEVLLKTLKGRSMTHEEQFRSALLCTTFGFEEGMILECEKRHDLQLPVAYFEANDDISSLLRFCMKNGSKAPTLWTQTLSILASRRGTERQIGEVLMHIERHRLLPPLTVLEVLQKSQAVTLDAVKDYFMRASDDLSEQLEQSQALLQSDRAEVSHMTKEIERYKSKAQVFESERCDFCFLPIELPSIHFRCGHSFHIYCLSNNSDNKTGILQADGLPQASYCCAICTPQFNAKRLLLAQREAEACNTDDFFKFLRGSADGFDFILSCFGRGLFPSRLKRIGLATKDVTGLDPLIRSYACAGANVTGDLLANAGHAPPTSESLSLG